MGHRGFSLPLNHPEKKTYENDELMKLYKLKYFAVQDRALDKCKVSGIVYQILCCDSLDDSSRYFGKKPLYLILPHSFLC